MNARCWFVDTGYWLALYNAADRRNARAQALAERRPPALVTTEAILLEIGDSLAGRQNRAFAVALLKRVRSASNIDVVPLTPDLLGRALQLYAARPDKDWGLTDCVSFEVMRERGIEEALAADQHFIQAGFRALLLEPG
jgi:hypothetical protein